MTLCDAPGPGMQHCNLPVDHAATGLRNHDDGRGGAPEWNDDIWYSGTHDCRRTDCPGQGWQPHERGEQTP